MKKKNTISTLIPPGVTDVTIQLPLTQEAPPKSEKLDDTLDSVKRAMDISFGDGPEDGSVPAYLENLSIVIAEHTEAMHSIATSISQVADAITEAAAVLKGVPE